MFTDKGKIAQTPLFTGSKPAGFDGIRPVFAQGEIWPVFQKSEKGKRDYTFKHYQPVRPVNSAGCARQEDRLCRLKMYAENLKKKELPGGL